MANEPTRPAERREHFANVISAHFAEHRGPNRQPPRAYDAGARRGQSQPTNGHIHPDSAEGANGIDFTPRHIGPGFDSGPLGDDQSDRGGLLEGCKALALGVVNTYRDDWRARLSVNAVGVAIAVFLALI